MINLLNAMDLILVNINFWFGLKPVFFLLYFEHDINVVPNNIHIKACVTSVNKTILSY